MLEDINQDSRRVRTITWEDPMEIAKSGREISGEAFLRGIRDGVIPQPPIARLMGYKLVEVGSGRAVFELEPAEYHYNPLSSVHGGVISLILDSAMTSAIISALPEGIACTTIELKVNYIRPVTIKTGLLRSEAETIHVGRKIATAQGKVFGKAGKLHAHATTTCSVFQIPS